MSEDNLSTMTSETEPKQDKEALKERWVRVERKCLDGLNAEEPERGRTVKPDHSSDKGPIAPEPITHLEDLSLTVDPINWRAGCVNSACPVRREGEHALSLPLSVVRPSGTKLSKMSKLQTFLTAREKCACALSKSCQRHAQ